MIDSRAISEIATRLERRDLFEGTETFESKLRKVFRDVPLHPLFPEDQRFPNSLRELRGKDEIRGLVLAGNESLLGESSLVGVCGSRHASERALEVTFELCRELAEAGVVIVSGYAAGIDERAHRAALSVGGSTACVLAEGIGHFRIKKSLADVWSWARSLVVSQFGISTVWQASRAMTRNSTIVGLSAATIVVEAKANGGTINAGMTALRLGKPLFVVDFGKDDESTAGNRLLIEQGALPLRKSRSTGLPSLAKLAHLVRR